jgi:hypothetical protein
VFAEHGYGTPGWSEVSKMIRGAPRVKYQPLLGVARSACMPRRLVYACAMRVGVHATTGDYSWQIVPDLTFMDAA